MSHSLDNFKTKIYFSLTALVLVLLVIFVWLKVSEIQAAKIAIQSLNQENSLISKELKDARKNYLALKGAYAQQAAEERTNLLQALPATAQITEIVRQIENFSNNLAQKDPLFNLVSLSFSKPKQQQDEVYSTLNFKLNSVASRASALSLLQAFEQAGKNEDKIGSNLERLINVKDFNWQVNNSNAEEIKLSLALEAYFFEI